MDPTMEKECELFQQVDQAVCAVSLRFNIPANDVRRAYYLACLHFHSPFVTEQNGAGQEDNNEAERMDAGRMEQESEREVGESPRLTTPLTSSNVKVLPPAKEYQCQAKLESSAQQFLISRFISSAQIYGYPVKEDRAQTAVDLDKVGKIEDKSLMRRLIPLERDKFQICRPCAVFKWKAGQECEVTEVSHKYELGDWYRGRIEAVDAGQVSIRLVDTGAVLSLPLPQEPQQALREVKPLPMRLNYPPEAYLVTLVGPAKALLDKIADSNLLFRPGRILSGKANLQVGMGWRQQGVWEYALYDELHLMNA